MADLLEDPEEFGNGAPLPVDSASVERGSFERLGEGQGVVSIPHSTPGAGEEHTWRDGLPVRKRVAVLMVVASLAAVAVIVHLVMRALDAPPPRVEEQPVVEQTVVAAGDSLTYRGMTYATEQSDGVYSLVEQRGDGSGEQVSLGELSGDPVALALFDGTLVIPENLANGTWDVWAYTIGSGWSQIMDQNGNAQAGTGVITAASLDGSELVVMVDGTPAVIPLVW